jgi:hypothetical protein
VERLSTIMRSASPITLHIAPAPLCYSDLGSHLRKYRPRQSSRVWIWLGPAEGANVGKPLLNISFPHLTINHENSSGLRSPAKSESQPCKRRPRRHDFPLAPIRLRAGVIKYAEKAVRHYVLPRYTRRRLALPQELGCKLDIHSCGRRTQQILLLPAADMRHESSGPLNTELSTLWPRMTLARRGF